jgi:hypothetical protein
VWLPTGANTTNHKWLELPLTQLNQEIARGSGLFLPARREGCKLHQNMRKCSAKSMTPGELIEDIDLRIKDEFQPNWLTFCHKRAQSRCSATWVSSSASNQDIGMAFMSFGSRFDILSLCLSKISESLFDAQLRVIFGRSAGPRWMRSFKPFR